MNIFINVTEFADEMKHVAHGLSEKGRSAVTLCQVLFRVSDGSIVCRVYP